MHHWGDFLNDWFGNGPTASGSNWVGEWMEAGHADRADRDGGRAVARYGRRVHVVAAVVTVIFAMLTVLTAATLAGSDRWFAVPVAGLTAVAAWCWVAVRRARVTWDRTTLWARAAGRGERAIPWADVRAVDVATWGSGHVIDGGPHGRVYVGRLLDGSTAVVEFARSEVRDRKHRRPGVPPSVGGRGVRPADQWFPR